MQEDAAFDADDLLTDAQDAFFEQRYEVVLRTCATVLASAPKESDAHDLLAATLQRLQRGAELCQACSAWETACGGSVRQLYYVLEGAYLSDNAELLVDATTKLAYLRSAGAVSDAAALGGIVLGCALAVDMGVSPALLETVFPTETGDDCPHHVHAQHAWVVMHKDMGVDCEDSVAMDRVRGEVMQGLERMCRAAGLPVTGGADFETAVAEVAAAETGASGALEPGQDVARALLALWLLERDYREAALHVAQLDDVPSVHLALLSKLFTVQDLHTDAPFVKDGSQLCCVPPRLMGAHLLLRMRLMRALASVKVEKSE